MECHHQDCRPAIPRRAQLTDVAPVAEHRSHDRRHVRHDAMQLDADLDYLQEQYESFSRLESEGLDADSDAARALDDDTRHAWQALRMHPDLRNLIMSLRRSQASSFRERFEAEGKA